MVTTILLTKEGEGRGSILVNGEVVCDPDCAEEYTPYFEGDTLTLDAIPESGSLVEGWKVNGEPVSGSVTIQVDDMITVIFGRNQPPVAAFSAAPLRGYAPLTVTFSNASRHTVTSSAWTFGDGATSTETNPTHVYATPGTYGVGLTVTGPGGGNTLTQPEMIEVLRDNQPPVVTITTPAEQAVAPVGATRINGTVTDDGELTSVTVNGETATITGDAQSGYAFTLDLPLTAGNQTLNVAAKDADGAFGFASRIVMVDGEGPEIVIHAPTPGQPVYTLHPQIDIAFDDFSSAIDVASVHVQLTDQQGVSREITGELTVTASQASGQLSVPLTPDSVYQFTVTVADALGNTSQRQAAISVPDDPDQIIPPDVPPHAGWIAGTVYDSATCGEYVTTCQPLVGARVTVAVAGIDGKEISGTALTGPEGLFLFPVAETNVYWVRIVKPGYTYAQREVEAVRDHSTATNSIYLTPLDGAITSCDHNGCHHESADGMMQVDIPAGAIPDGEVVPVTATSFRHVEFLPSGELPPGTAETYAFNLGGDSEATFLQPVTIKLKNYRGFAAGTNIPLGYWNQRTHCWEDAGLATIDAAGEWVIMSVRHFSNYDPNYPTLLTKANSTSTDHSEQDTPDGCSETQEGACAIDINTGFFKEAYALPTVSVLGREVAPRLLYHSRRAFASAVIDVEASMSIDDPNVEFGEYVSVEIYIEGRKTAQYSLAATPEQKYRYRYFWDGCDIHGNAMPAGVYPYHVKLSIPYRTQYYRPIGGFGTQPDYINGATGVFVQTTKDIWVRGTIRLDRQPASPFGDGWALAGQQRLTVDDAGQIAISDGEKTDGFLHANKNRIRSGNSACRDVVAWGNSGAAADQLLQALPEHIARRWQDSQTALLRNMRMPEAPSALALSSDGQRGYVIGATLSNAGVIGGALSVVELCSGQVLSTTTVDGEPTDIALSPDERRAYIVHGLSEHLIAVDTSTAQVAATINLGGGTGYVALAVSPDGAYAYVLPRFAYTSQALVVDLQAGKVVATMLVGQNPTDIALTADGYTAYITNSGDGTLSELDLRARKETAKIPVGGTPVRVALSANGGAAYVTDRSGNRVIEVDLLNRVVAGTIPVETAPHGIAVTRDSSTAYVANRGSNTISILDLSIGQQIAAIPTGVQPVSVALVNSADPTITSQTPTDRSRLTHDGSAYTRRYPNGTEVRFNADGTHAFTRDRLGNTTAYTYNADGTTAAMTITPAGEQTPRWTWDFAYQGGKLKTITDPAGRVTTFSIDGRNQLTAIAGPTPNPSEEGSSGFPSSEGQGVGTQRFTYDARSLMTQKTDEAGSTDTHVYDRYGRITQAANATREQYDTASGETGSGAQTIRFAPSATAASFLNDSPIGAPDAPAPPVITTDALTARVDYERGSLSGMMDRYGRWLTKTDALGHAIRDQRDAAGRLLQRAYPDNSCDEFRYDGAGNLLRVSRMDAAQCALPAEQRDPQQLRTTLYAYESRFQRVKRKIDPAGETTTYVYDYEEGAGEAGNLLRIEAPPVEDETGATVTPITRLTYSDAGQVTTVTDPQETITRYVYTRGSADEAVGGANARFAEGVTPVPGLLAQIIKDDASTPLSTGDRETITLTDYDAVGNPGTIIDAAGRATRLTYDLRGRPLTMTDARGIVTALTYDAAGRVAQMIEDYTEDGTTGRNVVTTYRYDAQGRRLRERSAGGGLLVETTYAYDKNGQFARVVDPNGHATSYAYDDANRLASVSDPLNQTTTYQYDDRNHLRFLTDAEQRTTEFVYNGLGQMTAEIRPMGEQTTSRYDAAGRLREREDANRITTILTYDAAGRVRQTRAVNAVGGQLRQVDFTYDVTGHLASYDDGVTSATYQYDGLGRKRAETVNYPGFSKTFEYRYGANGLKTSFTMPGATYEYLYTDAGELQTIRIPGVGDLSHPSFTRGLPDSLDFPGGVRQAYGFDAFQRLTDLSAQDAETDTLLRQQYSYDSANRVVMAATGQGHRRYAYDAASRLTNVTATDSTRNEAFSYDRVGNRTDGSVNANHELERSGEFTYTYDDEGNLTQKTGGAISETYRYDSANRLTQVEDALTGAILATYSYDPFGRRLWKDINGERTYFFYSDEGLVAEYDASGRELRAYGYRPDSTWTTDPVFLKQDDEYYWYLNDQLGTPQKLVDSTGSIVWSAQYAAFGKATIQIETVENNLRFPGQYFDKETGLHYNNQRYYDPEHGRYTQTDPIGFNGGDVNLYGYVGNNPINQFDSEGLLMLAKNPVEGNLHLREVLDFLPDFILDWLFPQTPMDIYLATLDFGCPLASVGEDVVEIGAKTVIKKVPKIWQITLEGTDRVMMHQQKFGKFYRSISDKLWWSKDLAGHGNSKWKVFKETSAGLEWIADADEFGNFILGKHKGDIGTFIPWKQLNSTGF